MKKILPPRRERSFDETVCLQRDSLDLYVDGELTDSAPINYDGMERLKAKVDDVMHSGVLFQIKIRNAVQWESTPTKLEFDPEQFSYEVNVL
jgi:hypothetical protein